MATGAHSDRAPLGVTVVLSVTLAAAGFALAMPVVMSIVPGKDLAAPFPTQHQAGETLVYLLTYVGLMPLAILAARRLADRLSPALVGVLAAGLVGALVAVKGLGRVAGHDGVKVVFAAAVVWWVAAGLLVWRRPALDRYARPVWIALAAALLLLLLSFTLLGSISVPGLLVALLVGAGALFAYGRARLTVPRRVGLGLDVLVLLLLALLVPDLVIFQPEEATRSLDAALTTGIYQFHQNFLLGPANEVLHGRPLLEGTASQYGVTSIWLLVGFFQIAPIGYGTFGFLAGALAALWFALGYAILRVAALPRWLSASTVGLGVVLLVFNLPYSIGGIPQDGPLRFGMPMPLVLVAALAERHPARRRVYEVLGLATLGLASVWSFEALGFTALTFAVLAVARGGLRGLVREAVAGLVACVLVHLLFAAIMLATTGELPEWGRYLAYIREFLSGDVGSLTYDVERWTPGFAVGGAYIASAAAAAELWHRRGSLLDIERAALIAIVGMTAYGIAIFSYYVNRSQGHVLTHIALPALLLGALWLGLLLRTAPRLDVRRAGLAAGLTVAALTLAVAWSAIDRGFGRTPLAHVVPGGQSLGSALDRLWHPPPLNPAAPEGQRVLARYLPGERRSLMMVSPDLGTEILIRSDRADALFLGDPWESSFVVEEASVTRAAVAALRPGRRMLLDASGRAVEATLARDPKRDVRRQPLSQLAPLQQYALQRIMARFTLRPVGPQDGAFSVRELVSRT